MITKWPSRYSDGQRGTTLLNERWVCHLALWVDDVPAKRAELERLGIVFETETLVDNDDLKTAFFTDPGGNRGQIVWRKKRLGGAIDGETSGLAAPQPRRLSCNWQRSRNRDDRKDRAHGYDDRDASPHRTGRPRPRMTLEDFREAEELDGYRYE